jgi:hypothetical protein
MTTKIELIGAGEVTVVLEQMSLSSGDGFKKGNNYLLSFPTLYLAPCQTICKRG